MQSRLTEVFETEFDNMVKLARVFLPQTADVEDAVMTAFVATAKRIDQLENPGGYLRTSVVNECRKRLRDQARRHRIWSQRVAPAAQLTAVNGDMEYVDDLLAELSERERTAIVLTYYLELRHEETAEILGCRPGTVKSLVHRGLKKMRVVVS